MISVETSRSGHPVLRQDGRFLGSSVDPLREASGWVDRQLPSLAGIGAVAVLGFGCGYHVRELAARRPDLEIVVFEGEAAVVERASGFLEPAVTARAVVEPDWRRLLAHSPVESLVKNTFAILRYGPSVQGRPDYFRAVEAILLGRDPASFALQLQARPELARELDMERVRALGEGLVSIKVIQGLFKSEDGRRVSHERALWKVLEELVL